MFDVNECGDRQAKAHTLPLATYIDDRYKSEDYIKNLYSGASGLIMRKSHSLMETGISPSQNRRVLEIGGGGLPHINWMDVSFTEQYTISDKIDIHTATLATLKTNLPPSIELRLHDFEKNPVLDAIEGGYTRIIASHVLEHIPDPEIAILSWSRMLSPDGVLSIAIPCDPGWMWRLGQKVGYNKGALGVSFSEYDLVMSREHINSVQRILKIIDYYFSSRRTRWFPALAPVVDFNLVCAFNLEKRFFLEPER